MKTFYVLWTYIANYSSLMEVKAETPGAALHTATRHYSDDFIQKATVYVFDTPPVLVRSPDKTGA